MSFEEVSINALITSKHNSGAKLIDDKTSYYKMGEYNLAQPKVLLETDGEGYRYKTHYYFSVPDSIVRISESVCYFKFDRNKHSSKEEFNTFLTNRFNNISKRIRSEITTKHTDSTFKENDLRRKWETENYKVLVMLYHNNDSTGFIRLNVDQLKNETKTPKEAKIIDEDSLVESYINNFLKQEFKNCIESTSKESQITTSYLKDNYKVIKSSKNTYFEQWMKGISFVNGKQVAYYTYKEVTKKNQFFVLKITLSVSGDSINQFSVLTYNKQ